VRGAAVDRVVVLNTVFEMFDLDCGGTISRDELMALGQARRQLGQKGGDWDEVRNERLMVSMNADVDGNVTRSNFVNYFNQSLSNVDDRDFMVAMDQFETAAGCCADRAHSSQFSPNTMMRLQQEEKYDDERYDHEASSRTSSRRSSQSHNTRQADRYDDDVPALTPRSSNLFSKIDANNDGVIDAHEFGIAMERGLIARAADQSIEASRVAATLAERTQQQPPARKPRAARSRSHTPPSRR